MKKASKENIKEKIVRLEQELAEKNRELTIEAALEKVRARTMAMQRSDELSEAVYILFQQFRKLGENPDQATIGIINEKEGVIEYWVTMYGNQMNRVFKFSFDEPHVTQKIYQAWKKGKKALVIDLKGNALKEFMAYRAGKGGAKVNPDEKRRIINVAFFSSGLLNVQSLKSRSAQSISLLKRFAGVFEQTYTRFLDLKKAESQAREAQIESSLERVRARAMAMKSSHELNEVVHELRKQMGLLGQKNLETCVIHLHDESPDFIHSWAAIKPPETDNEILEATASVPKKGLMIIEEALKAYSANRQDYVIINEGKKLRQWFSFLEKESPLGYQKLVESVHGKIEDLRAFWSFADFAGGALLMVTMDQPDNPTRGLLRRFANVFGLAYQRFADLKQAEAQAREAEIETGLERVRSRTLAMHKSEELADTAAVMFKQLIRLGIAPNRLYIILLSGDSDNMEAWVTDEDGSKVSKGFTGNYNRNESFLKMFRGWKEKKKSLIIDMQGEELINYFRYLNDELHVPFIGGLEQKRRVQHIAYFDQGLIGIASPEPQPEETLLLLERFAAVFNLTYARFHDLQVAEAQAQHARIETALEKVRARALAMQEPEELKDVARVLREEMGLLGVEELETSSIYMLEGGYSQVECWYAIKDVRKVGTPLVTDYFRLNLSDTWVGKQMIRFLHSPDKQASIIMQGENRKEWIRYCEERSEDLRGYYGETIPDRTYHLCKFSNGFIGAATPGEISIESRDLLQRAALVFSLAYSRFRDLTQARNDLRLLKEEKARAENALTELKATQAQLIQSEKMASLGELTTGIAHEIQNPLNFVNNFSEVNQELIGELVDEVDKENYEEVKIIAKDIQENEQKINHHGKRADAIVKSMLQHSRTSSGQKEPTDLNALCDEYLRLAYHGYRAKDKSFNVSFEMHLDPALPRVNVVPQDIGRVILNLVNNAFYACVERGRNPRNDKFEPMVSVSTKKINGKIEIRVADNGNGMPDAIKEKIFQPFFSTKPTGQGTGLGLSLSYDIVKAHGGEIMVESKEGEGTEFIVSLPV